jgi:hypothetical protein
VEPPFLFLSFELFDWTWGVCPILKSGGVDESNGANRFSTAIQGGRFFFTPMADRFRGFGLNFFLLLRTPLVRHSIGLQK